MDGGPSLFLSGVVLLLLFSSLSTYSLLSEPVTLRNTFFFKKIIYLLTVLGLHCCVRGLLSSCSALASHCPGFSYREWVLRRAGFSSCGSKASCFAAHEIFPDQGSNLCLLRLQADPLPLDHQGSPQTYCLNDWK